jgi:hypothetical protein
VNHVEGKERRDFQTRLIHSDALQLVHARRAAHVERRAEQAFADHLAVFGAEVAVGLAVEHLELAELFGERHARDERVDSAFNISSGGRLRGRSGGQQRRDEQARRQ